ncbi:hypothetical protein RchiOBHm_Chr1g0368401 [Rosa chinensis]|uniref:Uncharacterized protein n=1 Tax=Rosa chinensis TaxID=74649 RepID=A0A2P6SKR4_ROSCH|nr:hypothetical protein RchiOBHm_Chr1g0368401 [Rosa chinensis]
MQINAWFGSITEELQNWMEPLSNDHRHIWNIICCGDYLSYFGIVKGMAWNEGNHG